MLRTDLADRLLDELGEDGFVRPDYGRYCFDAVTPTAASVLGADVGRTLPEDTLAGVDTDVDAVLLFLVDGFGYDQWVDYHADEPFFRTVTDRGRVTPITSIYPSETAAAINTLHTGALATEHGVTGWNVYDRGADEEFVALKFQTADGTPPKRVERDEVVAAEALYPAMAEQGVESHHVVPFEDGEDGAERHGYDRYDLDTVPGTVGDAFAVADAPAYVYTYLPQVDSEGHVTGTESDEYAEVVSAVDRTLRESAREARAAFDGDVLVLVAADHGHVNTDPERNVDLTAIPAVEENLAATADGSPIHLSGNPRNVQLQLRDGTVETVRDALEAEYDVRTFTRDEAVETGLFGSTETCATFERRVGDLIVTHRDLGTWFGGDVEPGALDDVGMHGGMHRSEMLTEFAAVGLDDLLAGLD